MATKHHRPPDALRRVALYIHFGHIPPRCPHDCDTVRSYPFLCHDVDAYGASGYGHLISCGLQRFQ